MLVNKRGLDREVGVNGRECRVVRQRRGLWWEDPLAPSCTRAVKETEAVTIAALPCPASFSVSESQAMTSTTRGGRNADPRLGSCGGQSSLRSIVKTNMGSF